MRCLQCGSEHILVGIRVVDRAHGNYCQDLKVEVYQNPDAWIFKGAQEGTLTANVCEDCGFVMLSVSVADARKLASTLRSSRKGLRTRGG